MVMKRLLRWTAGAALAVLAALAGLAGAPSSASAQDGYSRRYFDEAPRYERSARPRRYEERRVYQDDRRFYDEDRAFQDRMRYYQRDSVSRREQARRSAYGDPQRAPQRRPNFFQRLFGASEPDDEPAAGWSGRAPVEVRPAPNRVRRKPPAEAAPTAPAALAAQPAVPPTTFVAVIGDSIADGLAGGLAEAFSDAPELAVKRYVKANAGLVRADYFDFVDVARKAVASDPITYAVIDVGVNDRQPFLDMRDALPMTDLWRQRYVARIDALLAPFKERKIPVYWVGLAPSGSVRASADHTALNALAKERVEAAGGTYVDVWEGFVDEAGDYAAVGPQLDGQTARLRLDDGVHFSKAGARKLAHYVEQEIRKVFQPKPQATPDALLSALTPGSEPGVDPNASPLVARPKPVAGPLVVLSAPRKADGGALLGAASRPAGAAEQVLVRGEAPDADPGRLDDHRWPGAETPTDPAKPQPATAEPAAAAKP